MGKRVRCFRVPMLIVCTLLSAVLLHAGGAKEDPIEQARELIVQRQYDQAILILSNIIETDPSRIDEAEALLSRVRSIKGNYNDLTQEFLDTITNEPENYEASLAIIEQMNALDPNPNDESRERIEKYRRVAKLAVDRTQKNRILAQAAAFIAEKKYIEAINLYISGFDLQRTEFDRSTLPEVLKTQVLSVVDETKKRTEALINAQNTLVPRLNEYAATLTDTATGIQRASSGFAAIANLYTGTLAQTVGVEQDAERIVIARAQAEETSPGDDANEFIRFIQEFMIGQSNKTGEGVRSAARSLMDTVYQDTLAGIKRLHDMRIGQVDAAVSQGRYEEAIRILPELYSTGSLLVRAHGLRGSQDLGTDVNLAGILTKLSGDFRIQPAQSQLYLDAYRTLETQLKVLITLASLRRSADNPVALEQALSLYAGRQDTLDDWFEKRAQAIGAGVVQEPGIDTFENIFMPSFAKASDGLIAFARENFQSQLNLSLADTRKTSDANEILLAQASENLTGVSLTEGGEAGVYRYPDRAFALTEQIAASDVLLSSRLNEMAGAIGGSITELKTWPVIQTVDQEIKSLLAAISARTSKRQTITAEASTNMRIAKQRLDEASARIQIVRQAIDPARLDLAAADTNYAQARDFYIQSLDLQYDAVVRNRVFDDLDRLGQDVEAARNIVLVRRIDRLIDEAQASFEREDYVAAQEAIDEAEAGYKQTSEYRLDPERSSNTLIVYWKGRIAAASNLSQERVISEADPAYFTLANYLSLARIDYQEARRQTGNGKPSDQVKQLISRAIASVDSVLLIKPNNWDAKTLKLRLDQLSDVDSFERRFALRVQEALANAAKSKSIDSLTDLQALYEINPAYGGLRQAIVQLEIDLGIRENPLTAARRQEAQRFVTEARRLAQNRDPGQRQQALQLTQRALALDPSNKEARDLADTLRTQIGGVLAALTFEDEQVYRRAESYFLAGRSGEALLLVNGLLENPKYRVLDQLQDLKSRIERQL